MQIQTTQQIADTLNEWAKARRISVKQLASEILGDACKHFLDGKIASLKDAVEDLQGQ